MSIVKVTFSLLLLLILLPIFFIFPINGSEDYNARVLIQGNVKGFQINKFENISDAEISVFKDDELISKTLSNFSGEYLFELPLGAYKIRASAEGFVENAVNVIIDPISNQTINFFLPKEGEDYEIKLILDNLPDTFFPKLEIDERPYGVALNDTKYSFQKGTDHKITIRDIIFVENKIRYILEGNSTQAFNQSTVIKFEYFKQYYVFAGEPLNLTAWYDEGALLITNEMPETIIFDNATQLIFESWYIDDTAIKGNPIAVTVNKSFHVSYEYKRQYFLRIESEYGNATGSGWYDEGTKAYVDIYPLEIKITLLRFIERDILFKGWKGDIETPDPNIFIDMDSPKTLKAEWISKEYLEPIYRAIVEISILICAAKILAGVFSKLELPEFLGELFAGIMLGPYALGSLKILGFQLITLNEYVLAFAQIGAIMILFVAGLETSFARFRRASVKSVIIGTSGVIIPLVLGVYVFQALGYDWNTSLIIGVVLAATSIAVTVKTLEQLKKHGSEESDVLISSAVIDDVLALIVLAIIISMITTHITPRMFDVGWLIFKTIVFWLILLFSVVFIAPRLIGIADRWQARGTVETVSTALCFGSAATAILIGLSPIIGAFSAGMALASSKIIVRIRDYISKISIIFSPIFFAVIGAELNLRIIGVESVTIALILFAIAVSSKLFGCGLPAIAMFKNVKKGLRVGVGMMARGEVALIITGIGISAGALTQNVYASIVVMVALTTIITPILMKQVFSSKKQIDDEKNN